MTDIVKKVEYRLKRADRFIITRYEESGPEDGEATSGGVEFFGEFDSYDVALRVAEKLAGYDHAPLDVSDKQNSWSLKA